LCAIGTWAIGLVRYRELCQFFVCYRVGALSHRALTEPAPMCSGQRATLVRCWRNDMCWPLVNPSAGFFAEFYDVTSPSALWRRRTISYAKLVLIYWLLYWFIVFTFSATTSRSDSESRWRLELMTRIATTPGNHSGREIRFFVFCSYIYIYRSRARRLYYAVTYSPRWEGNDQFMYAAFGLCYVWLTKSFACFV